MKFLYTGFLLFFPILSHAQMNAGAKLLSKNNYYEIPYQNSDSVILTHVQLKGSSHLFMLDSGAPVFISDSLQRLYNFPVIHETTVRDATGKTEPIKIIRIDTLKLGPFVVSDLLALVLNMKSSAHQCDAFVGNFGSNAMQFLVIEFDLRKGKIALTDNPVLLQNKDTTGFHSAMLNSQSDILFPVKVNDGFTDTVQFDTGDGYLYHISEKAMVALSALYPGQVVRRGIGVTAIGSLGIPENSKQMALKANKLLIANSTIAPATLFQTSAPRSRIGRYLLNYGVLRLDYINSRYAFTSYKNPVLPGKYDFGFTPVINGRKVIAGTVWQGSEAENNGMKSGNEILAIDDFYFSTLSLCDVEPKAKDYLSKNTIRILFKNNNGQTKRITLDKKYY